MAVRMRKTFGLLLVVLTLVSALALQPAPTSAAPASASSASTVAVPTKNLEVAGGGVIQRQLIWTSGTLVANAYGTQVYEATFRWAFCEYDDCPVDARPGIKVQWHARLIDHKVISGGGWSDASIAVPGGWYQLGGPFVWFTPANQPYRLIDAHFYFNVGTPPVINNLYIEDLKIDYLGNAAGLWVWKINF
jgi:hypothetical protein